MGLRVVHGVYYWQLIENELLGIIENKIKNKKKGGGEWKCEVKNVGVAGAMNKERRV